MDKKQSYAARMQQKISEKLMPLALEVIDESAKHHGHAGAHAQGESHFRLKITAAAFNGLSRVARQRLVYDLVKAEMDERVHALSLELKAENE